MNWSDFLSWTFYGNTIAVWAIAIAVAVITVAGLLVIKRTGLAQLRALARRADSDFVSIGIAVVRSTRLWFLILVAIRAGALALQLPPRVVAILQAVVVVGFLLQLAMWGSAALGSWLDRYSTRRMETDAASVTTMRAVVFIVRLLVWSVVLLVGLDNLGINITALIAGLGVGGIAVALAAQNILGDLFSSMSIVIDKPFVVGDFIIIDDFLGTVDHIGLKTTRLRSLGGEQLVFSNSDLLKSRIRNYKQMQERRTVFSFRVDYQTSFQKLQSIPPMVREIVEAQELARFDRAHFKEYGEFALIFEVVYYVLVPGYNEYMDVQQTINFELFQRFEAEGIRFAYPTQRLYVKQAGGAGGGEWEDSW